MPRVWLTLTVGLCVASRIVQTFGFERHCTVSEQLVYETSCCLQPEEQRSSGANTASSYTFLWLESCVANPASSSLRRTSPCRRPVCRFTPARLESFARVTFYSTVSSELFPWHVESRKPSCGYSELTWILTEPWITVELETGLQRGWVLFCFMPALD